MSLSQAILPKLKEVGKLTVPKYDVTKLRGGILHLGVGNFHRSHFAAYMNDLFINQAEANQDWGIIGGGIMSFDADKRSLLESQDWLQTVVEQDATSSKASILGSMIDFLPVDYINKEHKELQSALVNPAIRIVSLTVTEGGYFLSDGRFNVNDPQIKHDITTPDTPHTIFGMMVKALKIRREQGIPPFTVMSCDNMPHNGKVTKSSSALREMNDRLAHMKIAVDAVDAPTDAERGEIRRLEGVLADAATALYGDGTIAGRNEAAPVGIMGRLGAIRYGGWSHTSPVTGSERAALDIAERELSQVIGQLRGAEASMQALADRLEALGAPYTPGSGIPDLPQGS